MLRQKFSNHPVFTEPLVFYRKVASERVGGIDHELTASEIIDVLGSRAIGIDDASIVQQAGRHYNGTNVTEIVGWPAEKKIGLFINRDTREFSFSYVQSFYPNTPFHLVLLHERLYFFGSFETPIDVIIDVDTFFIYKSEKLKFDCIRACRLLLSQILRRPPKWDEDLMSAPKEIGIYLKDSRPAHVLFDELPALYSLRQSFGGRVKCAFAPGSAYLEPEAVPDCIGIVNLGKEVQNYSDRYLFFRNLERLKPEDVDGGFRSWIRQCALARYNVKKRPADRLTVWLGITGGERRSWLEEQEALCLIVDYFRKSFPDVFFVFDGYTGCDMGSTDEWCQVHNSVLKSITDACGLKASEYVSLIGSQILRKVAYATTCDFFITMLGTPSNWISNVAQVPGVLHANSHLISRGKLNYFEDNVTLVPNDIIVDEHMCVNERDRKKYGMSYVERSGGFQSYSICENAMLDVVKKAFALHWQANV